MGDILKQQEELRQRQPCLAPSQWFVHRGASENIGHEEVRGRGAEMELHEEASITDTSQAASVSSGRQGGFRGLQPPAPAPVLVQFSLRGCLSAGHGSVYHFRFMKP